MSDSKTRRRRYRQFSLRTFLVMLSLGCVWLGWEVNRANQQRQAVAWVLEMGGTVKYDHQVNENGVVVLDAKATGPEWLRDFYDHVVCVDLNQKPVRDLTLLANLKSLKKLHLHSTHVKDLTPLANLRSLQSLYLSDTQVESLAPLANLKRLKELILSDTQVRDLTPLANLTSIHTLWLQHTSVRDIAPLAHLTSLRTLYLHDAPIRDLTPLANLKSLQQLGLGQTQVSDLSPLANLHSLTLLDLHDTPIRDLAPLTNLKSLTSIDLRHTQVRDLTPLTNLKRLSDLRLYNTPASEEQTAKLQQALPDCVIRFEVSPIGVAYRKPISAPRRDIPIVRMSRADYEGWSADAFFTGQNELQICAAISSGDKDRLKPLLDAGVELNKPGKYGFTVLYWAYMEGSMEAFELLLEHGADPDLRLTHDFHWSGEGPVESLYTDRRKTALYPFVKRHSIFFTSFQQFRPTFGCAAVKYSKNVNQLCHDDYGQNMLHYFLVTGTANPVGLPMLIDAGVDLNAKDALGMTPCKKALMVHHGCLLQLLEAGSDPSGVAETLEHWLWYERQQPDVDDPLIKWFREHGREIRPIKSKDQTNQDKDK